MNHISLNTLKMFLDQKSRANRATTENKLLTMGSKVIIIYLSQQIIAMATEMLNQKSNSTLVPGSLVYLGWSPIKMSISVVAKKYNLVTSLLSKVITWDNIYPTLFPGLLFS